jgi:hypothetical protein
MEPSPSRTLGTSWLHLLLAILILGILGITASITAVAIVNITVTVFVATALRADHGSFTFPSCTWRRNASLSSFKSHPMVRYSYCMVTSCSSMRARANAMGLLRFEGVTGMSVMVPPYAHLPHAPSRAQYSNYPYNPNFEQPNDSLMVQTSILSA